MEAKARSVSVIFEGGKNLTQRARGEERRGHREEV
jgi:hypothetical protein